MEKNHFSETTIFLMIFVALCADGAQALIGWIPAFGNILADFFSILVFMTFFLWFKMHGISMMTPKRLKALAIGGIVELVPFLNILPAWTGVVVYLIGTTKIKEIASKHPALSNIAMGASGKITGLNKEGNSQNSNSQEK